LAPSGRDPPSHQHGIRSAIHTYTRTALSSIGQTASPAHLPPPPCHLPISQLLIPTKGVPVQPYFPASPHKPHRTVHTPRHAIPCRARGRRISIASHVFLPLSPLLLHFPTVPVCCRATRHSNPRYAGGGRGAKGREGDTNCQTVQARHDIDKAWPGVA
jgi:hypothetical protein